MSLPSPGNRVESIFTVQSREELLSYYKKMLRKGRVERGQYIISIENNDQNSRECLLKGKAQYG
jgi:hypothetical protein